MNNVFDVQVAEKILSGKIENYANIVEKYTKVKLDKNETITLSTRQSITNKYEETLTPLFITNPNEGATVEFSSPLYAFFKKDQMLNIYMKDEFPLLIVANDRILLKAPHIGA